MNFWKISGEYFGFPKCCIEEFSELTDEKLKAGQRTGFVPCKKHARLIIAGRVAIQDLITNRVCAEPFPESGDLEVFKKHLEAKMDGPNVY